MKRQRENDSDSPEKKSLKKVDATIDLMEDFVSACRGGELAKVEKLLRNSDVDVNEEVGEYEVTALHFAAENGHVDVVIVLLDNGADVNIVDAYNATALHYTAENGHVDVAKTLIQNGADVNAADFEKLTALHHTAEYAHIDVAKVLIQNGAELNAVNGNKRTALHFAALHGHADVAKVLIQNGADVKAADKWTSYGSAGRTCRLHSTTSLLWS